MTINNGAETSVSERDELADVFTDHPVGFGVLPKRLMRGHAQEIAESILAAGYTKPKQITTAEELDALPEGAVIRDASGKIRERFDAEGGAALWLRPGAKGWMLSGNFRGREFPATVLYSPAVGK